MKLTEGHKKKISNKLKKAHAEGRHPGWSHINQDINKRSYPEKWLANVLKNEGIIEKYNVIEQFSFGKYFLDFAIINLKIDIEIDGNQHFRNPENIEHDKIRDLYLNENGWSVYRLSWSELFNDTKEKINHLLHFIETKKDVSNRYYDYDEVLYEKKYIPKYGCSEKYRQAVRKQNDIKNKDLILKLQNSNINFSKLGWVGQASKIIGITPQKVTKWMKRNLPNLYKTCYKRNTSVA